MCIPCSILFSIFAYDVIVILLCYPVDLCYSVITADDGPRTETFCFLCWITCYEIIYYLPTGLLPDSSGEEFKLQLLQNKIEDAFWKFNLCPWLYSEEQGKVDHFYIRQAYKDIYELAIEQSSALILGTPGTGKTIFCLYVLCRLLQNNATVVVERVNFPVFVFNNEGVFRLPSMEAVDTEILSNKSLYYLYDAATHVCRPKGIKATRFIFSSPEKENWSDVVKAGVVTYYMPIWSVNEVEEVIAHHKMPDNRASSVRDRFGKFGGIPRILFEKNSERAEQYDNEVVRQCNSIEVKSIDSLQLDKTHVKNHKLLHMKVDDSYTRYRVAISSTYVAKMMYDALVERQKENLYNFLNVSSDVGEVGAIRGKLFEMYCHDLFSKGGTFQTRCIDGERESLTFPCMKVYYFKSTEDLSSMSSKPDFYAVPWVKNYETVDSIIPSLKICFQMTISRRHSIKSTEHVLKIFGWERQAVHLRLYFVVPNVIYESFRPELPKKRSNLSVYVLCVPFDE